LEHWKMLDVTGRDRGFGESPLREEAIDAHLKRYGANDPDVYETLFKIEMTLFSHRQEEEKKKQEREKKKSEAKNKGGPQKNYSAPVPRRSASMGRRRR
jgi:septal ring factor EnvC (AmiA/AmiB activator)